MRYVYLCVYVYIYIYVWWPTMIAPHGGSVLARLTLGDLDYGLEGAEKR